MKKTFVKPEMKCHKLRAGNLLVIESGDCVRQRDPDCRKQCYYKCQVDFCQEITGGGCTDCSGHCSTYVF